MKCLYMHKLCEAGCDNHVCRAFFPEKQPIISKLTKDVCTSDDYMTECLVYVAGMAYQEEKRRKGRTEKCPFAQNNRCGRPWEWWCKGGQAPFLLTTFEIIEGTDDMPIRVDGNIKFTYDEEAVKWACWSGDSAIYMECPAYKAGVAQQEFVRNIKNKEKQ